jgi:hypothetical protein
MSNSKVLEILNNKTYQIIFVIVLVFISIAGKPIAKVLQGKEITPVDTTPEIVEPSLTNKTLVERLVSLDINKSDKNQLRDYFLTLADVVKTEPGLIKTTEQFKNFNSIAGQLNFTGLDLKDKYANLGESVDEIIIATLGKENEDLTQEKRDSLVDVLNAISWSFNQ